MRILEINNILYKIPSKWSELTKKDLLEVCKIMLKPCHKKYQKFLLLKHFTGLNYSDMKRVPAEALPDVIALVEFLFQEPRLTKNHFPELKGLKGPDDGLTNFTFEQFLGQAEQYNYSIAQGNYHHIDDLINVMYNYNGSDKDFEKLKKLPEEIKLAVYIFYQGCSWFIKKKFKAAFSGGTESKAQPDGLEFVRLVNSLNLNDVSKNEAIKQTNLYEALTYLTTLINKTNGENI